MADPWKRKEVIGDCTLYLGDCVQIMPLLGPVGAVVTDPPYSSGGQFRGDRMAKPSEKYQQSESAGLYREFSGDNRDQRGFAYWSTVWASVAREISVPGAIFVSFTDWRQLPATTDYLQAGGWIWRGICPWDKGEGTRPQLGRYRAQAEYFVWGTNGPRPLAGPVAPGAFRVAVKSGEKLHMTGKPVDLMSGILAVCEPPILDPFMGSASTAIAAIRRGLPFVGVETNPHYFDVACERVAKAVAQPGMFAPDPAPAPAQTDLMEREQ